MQTKTLFRFGQLAAPLSLAATIALGFSNQASAFTLGPAQDFNVFVLGDVLQSNTDVEGRMAVGGNAVLTGYGVGDKLTNSQGTRDDLIVGGKLTYNSGQVFNGNAVYGGTEEIDPQVGFPNGSHYQGTPIDFTVAKQQLFNLSTSLGNLTPTGTTSFQYGQIALNGAGSGLNVFNVSGTQLSTANSLSINADANATVVVNITGEEINFGNLGISLNGVNKQKVLYNFVDATKLSSSGVTILGSVLAANAAYEFNNGNLEGTLIAGSLTGNGEFHNHVFQGDIPPDREPSPVPEPAALVGLGLVAAAGVGTRRKHKNS
ncbi:MAG TPA: choice-of-anchor A family protein [Coleofasciculaceae cyanobacterium]